MTTDSTTPNQASVPSGAVFNQPPPLVDLDLFSANRPLVEAVKRSGASWAESEIAQVGKFAGSAEAIELARAANQNPPILRTHDRYGHRIDEVEFHPAWHELMKYSVNHGLHALPWRDSRPGAHAARAAMFTIISQTEAGHGCPISMTSAIVPALRMQPELAAEWEPLITSLEYDFGLRPPAQKAGLICGMALTERQGGSDVRANTTTAQAIGPGGAGGEYTVTGHKWFCSAPMSDLFLILAQTDQGLSCFLLPRVLPDGSRNGIQIERLKDKLGNRSNASGEILLTDAWARMVGEPGRGVQTIVEMVNHTRFDCVIGATSGMRAGVEQATHHAAHRSAFGRLLVDQPLMQNVLADLCVESEAATVTMMRLAAAYDAAADDQHEAALKRNGTAIAKYWICKRWPAHAAESLECLGGNGYVEDSGLPRLYREAPVLSIWEGSGNVICLDVLRVLTKEPDTLGAFFAEVDQAAGDNRQLDAASSSLRAELGDVVAFEARARRIVERMALVLQASLLVRFGAPEVADVFCASRLAGDWGNEFGTLQATGDFSSIIERHRPSA